MPLGHGSGGELGELDEDDAGDEDGEGEPPAPEVVKLDIKWSNWTASGQIGQQEVILATRTARESHLRPGLGSRWSNGTASSQIGQWSNWTASGQIGQQVVILGTRTARESRLRGVRAVRGGKLKWSNGTASGQIARDGLPAVKCETETRGGEEFFTPAPPFARLAFYSSPTIYNNLCINQSSRSSGARRAKGTAERTCAREGHGGAFS